MGKPLLIIQFRTDPRIIADEQEEFKKSIGTPTVALVFKNALLDSLSWSTPRDVLAGAAGVILGGSGELDFDGNRPESDEKKQMAHRLANDIKPFLNYLAAEHLPLLAICFGHQLVAAASGTAIVHDAADAKIGSHEVALTPEGKRDPLFGDLPERFMVQYGHRDVLGGLPSGATLLASGERCSYAALRLGLRRYSVQFHPELDAEDFTKRLARSPSYLPHGLALSDIVQESPSGTKLLRTFVRKFIA